VKDDVPHTKELKKTKACTTLSHHQKAKKFYLQHTCELSHRDICSQEAV